MHEDRRKGTFRPNAQFRQWAIVNLLSVNPRISVPVLKRRPRLREVTALRLAAQIDREMLLCHCVLMADRVLRLYLVEAALEAFASGAKHNHLLAGIFARTPVPVVHMAADPLGSPSLGP